MSTENANAIAPQTIQINISKVLADLAAGKTREQIRLELGLTKGQLVTLFKQPKLKGRKTHTASSVLNIVDDAPEVTPLVRAARTVSTTPETSAISAEAAPASVNEAEVAPAPAPAPEAPAVVEPEEVKVEADNTKSPWS